MNDLDRVVTRFRLWVEDHLPWYDREQEQQAAARTEAIRRRSQNARIRAEAIQAGSRFHK